MKVCGAVTLAGMLLFGQPNHVSGQAKATMKVFLLEDLGKNQWCAYGSESTWNTAVQDVEAMTVGTLSYVNDSLSQIDVTQTDESGDWTVYDHYLLNDRGDIVRLSRIINVLPGDRSVAQTFAISNGKAQMIATTEKELSTGKPLNSPKPVWLPDLPITTRTQMFPFSSLLGRPGLATSSESCVQTSGAEK